MLAPPLPCVVEMEAPPACCSSLTFPLSFSPISGSSRTLASSTVAATAAAPGRLSGRPRAQAGAARSSAPSPPPSPRQESDRDAAILPHHPLSSPQPTETPSTTALPFVLPGLPRPLNRGHGEMLVLQDPSFPLLPFWTIASPCTAAAAAAMDAGEPPLTIWSVPPPPGSSLLPLASGAGAPDQFCAKSTN